MPEGKMTMADGTRVVFAGRDGRPSADLAQRHVISILGCAGAKASASVELVASGLRLADVRTLTHVVQTLIDSLQKPITTAYEEEHKPDIDAVLELAFSSRDPIETYRNNSATSLQRSRHWHDFYEACNNISSTVKKLFARIDQCVCDCLDGLMPGDASQQKKIEALQSQSAELRRHHETAVKHALEQMLAAVREAWEELLGQKEELMILSHGEEKYHREISAVIDSAVTQRTRVSGNAEEVNQQATTATD